MRGAIILVALVLGALGCGPAAPAQAPAPGPAAAAPAPAAAATAPAAATAADAAPTEPACTAEAPTPLLDPSSPDHRFARGADNQATESATLPGGVRVEVGHFGCVDGKGWQVVFTTDAGGLPASPRAAALERLRALTPSKPGASFVATMIEEVEHTPARARGKISRCLDGKPSDDGTCGFERQGRFTLDAVAAGAGAAVTVELLFSL